MHTTSPQPWRSIRSSAIGVRFPEAVTRIIANVGRLRDCSVSTRCQPCPAHLVPLPPLPLLPPNAAARLGLRRVLWRTAVAPDPVAGHESVAVDHNGHLRNMVDGLSD